MEATVDSHTEGEWRACPKADGAKWLDVLVESAESGDECVLARISPVYGEGLVLEPAHANARLIAAAPTMASYIEKKAAEGDAEAAAIWSSIIG